MKCSECDKQYTWDCPRLEYEADDIGEYSICNNEYKDEGEESDE